MFALKYRKKTHTALSGTSIHETDKDFMPRGVMHPNCVNMRSAYMQVWEVQLAAGQVVTERPMGEWDAVDGV